VVESEHDAVPVVVQLGVAAELLQVEHRTHPKGGKWLFGPWAAAMRLTMGIEI
jgi:hypothetical protein